MDSSSLIGEDIKIKKEQDRANCYGFDVRILIKTKSLIISLPQDDSDLKIKSNKQSRKKASVI